MAFVIEDAAPKTKPHGRFVIEGDVNEGFNPVTPFVEAAMNMGSGLFAKPVSDIAGLAATGVDMFTGSNQAEEYKQYVQDQLTYQPRTEAGKVVAEYNPIALVGKGIGAISNAAGDFVGNGAAADTLQGISGNFIREAIPQALSILGSMKSAPKKIAAGLEKITPDSVPLLGSDGLLTKAIIDLNRARKSNIQGKVLLAEEALRDIASKLSPKELAQTIKALEGSTKPIVPGSPVTSADAIARGNMSSSERFGAPFVKLEENLSRIPEANKILTDPKLAGEAARAGILEKGAGTARDMAKAESARSVNANINYGAVKNFIVKSDNHIGKLLSRPSMAKAMERARDLAAEKGDEFKIGADAGAKYPVQSLQYVKMALDNMLQNPKDYGIAGSEIKAIAGTRAAFMQWMEKKAPLYKKANDMYAADSVPISRMKLWGQLKEKFIPPTGLEARGSYLKALRDETKTLKSAGVRSTSEFNKVFDVKNSALAAKLAAEMEAGLMKKRISGEVNMSGSGKMAEAVEPTIPPMLTTVSTVSRWLISKIAKDADVGINIAAAKILAEPKMLSNVLKTVNPHQRGALFKSIKETASSKYMTVGAPQTATKEQQ